MLAEMISARLQDNQSMFPQFGPVAEIQRAVAEMFNISVEQMWYSCRARDIARPRQIAMYLVRELTGYSLPRIGLQFGGRDHTTVLHACRVVQDLCDYDPRFRATVEMLRAALTAPVATDGTVEPAMPRDDLISSVRNQPI